MITFDLLEENFTEEEIVEIFTKIEVTEIIEPEDAFNDRDNPEVEVAVHVVEHILEQYCFEFVHPKHQREDVYFEKYSYSIPRISEGAKQSKHQNEAAFKAAEALADYTGIPVESLIRPSEALEDE